MDSQVKERIVGAAVLVVLGVWLIPWVLDGPGDPSAPAGSAPPLSLPPAAETAPIRTETVELDSNLLTAEPSPDITETSTEPTAVAIVTAGVAEPIEPSSPSGLRESPPPPQVRSSEPGTGTPAVAGWAVQVGAFGEIANADQLVTRVSSYGYPAFVSEFRSGGATMYRVRVGGLDSEGDAEAAASALSARGIPVQVIPPE